jgi:hypothetical protein
MTPAWLAESGGVGGVAEATGAGVVGRGDVVMAGGVAMGVLLVVALPVAGEMAGDGCIAHPARTIMARIEDESRNCFLR